MRRVLLATTSGALLAAAFPSPDIGWIAWVAVAPVMALAVTARSVPSASMEGYAFGLAFHGLTFQWWYGLLVDYGRLSHPEAAAVYLGLALYVGAYGAMFAACVRAAAARHGQAAAILLAPAVWAGLELIRSRAFTGLPWSLLGATQHRALVFIQVADFGGVAAVSLVVAAGNAAVAGAFLARRARGSGDVSAPWTRACAALLAVPALALAYGSARLSQEPHPIGTIRAGLIQGNVTQEEKWEASEGERILEAHLQATRRAAEAGARLVIWSESSVPLPLTSHPSYRSRLESLAGDLGVDLLVGSVHYEDPGRSTERTFNSAFLLRGSEPGAAAQRYDKIHLVPYGEYVPLRPWLGFVRKLVVEAGDFSPGDRVVVMRSGGRVLAPLICFEAIFPALVRRFTREGAQVLVNITNDAMLGRGAGPRQHLQLSLFRAVENRRYLLRAANTGISAVVDAHGRVIEAAACGREAVLVADAQLYEGLTPYARFGDVLGWTCVIVAVAATIARRARTGDASWTRIFSGSTPP